VGGILHSTEEPAAVAGTAGPAQAEVMVETINGETRKHIMLVNSESLNSMLFW
jgi:hypothetical protein